MSDGAADSFWMCSGAEVEDWPSRKGSKLGPGNVDQLDQLRI